MDEVRSPEHHLIRSLISASQDRTGDETWASTQGGGGLPRLQAQRDPQRKIRSPLPCNSTL